MIQISTTYHNQPTVHQNSPAGIVDWESHGLTPRSRRHLCRIVHVRLTCSRKWRQYQTAVRLVVADEKKRDHLGVADDGRYALVAIARGDMVHELVSQRRVAVKIHLHVCMCEHSRPNIQKEHERTSMLAKYCAFDMAWRTAPSEFLYQRRSARDECTTSCTPRSRCGLVSIASHNEGQPTDGYAASFCSALSNRSTGAGS